ncbi:MAG: phosphomannomutase/phosphoglucomutase [Pseudomonadota bacterium]
MFPKPRPDLKSNTPEFEVTPLAAPTGFREYDARWLFPEDVNLMGIQALGMGIATQMHRLGVRPVVVTGHDYRSYSQSIKYALITGLMASGCEVLDIGLALSPMAYFAQFELDAPAVAMVTASHNDNGWTGVKIGMERPLTHGPDQMAQLKEIVLSGNFIEGRGAYKFIPDLRAKYLADMTRNFKLKHNLKVVAACGNGTAGLFAPDALRAIGAEVVELDCVLDFTFPNHNPNPEDMKMLHALRDAVLKAKADVGLAFDGDGDRCGVVDNEGEEIFADKIGLFLARDFSTQFPNSTFVVDVKSTGLYQTDDVLHGHGAKIDYWKTGHSHMKRRVKELNALAGFEKSGHYFFNPPFGHGYDDGLVSALAVCRFLDNNPGRKMADLRRALPMTWGSPTMAPFCPDETKYSVVDQVSAHYQKLAASGGKLLGQNIREVVTVNGVRVVLEDGTWGLVRASSNKPSLVVVVESPVSEQKMRDMFAEIDARLSAFPDIGEYDQKI